MAKLKILDIGLEGMGFVNFKKLIDVIMPPKERRQSTIIIMYIRVFAHLNNALNLLDRETCKRAVEHIGITKNILDLASFNEEKPYVLRIRKIISTILRNEKEIVRRIEKEPSSDPFHVKTSILLAQNVCILRILKINKY